MRLSEANDGKLAVGTRSDGAGSVSGISGISVSCYVSAWSETMRFRCKDANVLHTQGECV